MGVIEGIFAYITLLVISYGLIFFMMYRMGKDEPRY